LNSSSQPTHLVHKICLLKLASKAPNQRNFLHFAKIPKLLVLETLKILFQKSPNTHSNSFKGGGGRGVGGGATQSAIEMAEDVEKRFERAMDCLFPGSSSRGAAAAATRVFNSWRYGVLPFLLMAILILSCS
jgi:hypothetical protein